MQYQGNKTYSDNIYIFDSSDYLLGDLEGTSNIPIKQLSDSVSYLKKFKGSIIKGNGNPNGKHLLDSDSLNDNDTIDNTIYIDLDTGDIWKVTDLINDTWINTYKDAIINLGGIKFNSDSDYLELKYDGENLNLTDSNGNFANMKMDNIIVNSIGSNNEILNSKASEILLLYDINSTNENTSSNISNKILEIPSESIILKEYDISDPDFSIISYIGDIGTIPDKITNGQKYIEIIGYNETNEKKINGFYKIDHIEIDQDELGNIISSGKIFLDNNFRKIIGEYEENNTGSFLIDNSAMIRWDNDNNYFSFQKRDGTRLPISINGVFVNGVPVSYVANRVIESETDFDNLFNNNNNTTICYLRKPETNYQDIVENEIIYVKKKKNGDISPYELKNNLEILGSNIRILFIGGAELKPYSYTISYKSSSLIPVTEKISNNEFRIEQKDCYHNLGLFDKQEINIEIDNNIQLYSSTNLNYTKNNKVSTISKRLDSNSNQVNVRDNNNPANNIEGTNPVSHPYYINNENKSILFYNNNGNIVYMTYKYDNSNNFVMDEQNNNVIISSSNNIIREFDNTIVIMNRSNGFGVNKINNLELGNDFNSYTDGNNEYINPYVFIKDEYIHMLYLNGGQLKYIKSDSTIDNTITFSSANIVISDEQPENIDVLLYPDGDDTKILIAYKKYGENKIKYHEFVNELSTGQSFSVLDAATNEFQLYYDEEPKIFYVSSDNTKTISLIKNIFNSPSKISLLNSSTDIIDRIEIKINKYNSEDYKNYLAIGYSNILINPSKVLRWELNNYDDVTVEPIISEVSSKIGNILQLDNNYITFCGSTSDPLLFLEIFNYYKKIRLDNNYIDNLPSDLLLTNEPIRYNELDIIISSDVSNPINIKNLTFSKIKVISNNNQITNSLIDGELINYNNNFNISSTDVTGNIGLNGLLLSNINDSFIDGYNDPIKNSKSINFIGFVDNDAIIYNGDYI